VRYTSRVRRTAAVCISAIGLTAACGGAPPPQPNLLLITIDTLRADYLSCYGDPTGVGARTCALFEDGLRYRWAFSTAPTTSPSIASLLTSRYPGHHGVTQSLRSYLDDSDTTVAETLRNAGYTTAAFVSNPVLDRRRNLGQGFEIYDQRTTRRERNRPGYVEREAAATTDAALAWARAARREPWFLWVHFQDPHGPYESPDATARSDPAGAARLPVLDDDSGRNGIPAYQVLPGLFTPPAYERRYRDEIAYMDPHVARLVEGLDALGRRPAVLLTADHGEAFGEDGYWFAHGHSVGLDQIRVPLLFRPPVPAPGAGTVIDTPVSLLDVAPSLLHLAGIETPSTYQGRRLPLDAKPPRRAAPIFSEHGEGIAVIQGRHFYSRARVPDVGIDAPDAAPGDPLLAPRTAELPRADVALPGYQPLRAEDPMRALDAAVDEHLQQEVGHAGRRHEGVPEELRARARALGYSED